MLNHFFLRETKNAVFVEQLVTKAGLDYHKHLPLIVLAVNFVTTAPKCSVCE